MNKEIITLWVDESGDCGFKFEKGSSRFLIIVAVYADSNESEGGIVKAIDAVKQERGLDRSFEFKFSRCKDALKKVFLDEITKYSIAYKAIVLDKKNLGAPALQYHPRELYCEAVRRLLYDNDPPLARATLILDEATAKIHHREFSGMLKRYLSRNMVKKIKQMRSESEAMIQVADMIAGSILREYEKGDPQWHQIIKGKEKRLIVF